MTAGQPLRTDFHAQQHLYSPDVQKVKKWFEHAVSQLSETSVADNTILGVMGVKTLLYIGESNTSYKIASPLDHIYYANDIKNKFGFGNLIAVLDPDTSFDNQWPTDRYTDTIFDMAIGAVKSQQVQDFLKPPQRSFSFSAFAKQLFQPFR